MGLAAFLALHVILGAAAIATALPVWARIVALAALAAHAALRRPAMSPPIAIRAEAGVVEVAGHPYDVDPGTAYTSWWVRLRLVDEAGCRCEIVLVRDQLDAAAWSGLQSWLRRYPR